MNFTKEEMETINKFFEIVDKHKLFVHPETDDVGPELRVDEYLAEEFGVYYYANYDKPSEYVRDELEQLRDMYRAAGL